MESAKLIALLARMLRDVGRAEELAQDALVSALEQWPRSGVPDRPGAWLTAAARNHALDELRHGKVAQRKHAELQGEAEARAGGTPLPEDGLDDDIGDDLLRLMFVACHPVLSTEARVALTLRLLGGLTTEEIARAFLVAEPTIAQRIVRAKRTLAKARVPFEIPRGEALAARLSSVLEVIYLVFIEGYAATAGDDWMRPALCEEALRLAHPHRARAAGTRCARAGRADGTAGVALRRAGGAERPADPAPRSVARLMGLAVDSPRTGGAGARRGTGRRARSLRAAGGRSGVPRARALPPIPTGHASLRSTMRSRSLRRPRSLTSIGPVAVSMAFGPAAALEIVEGLRDDPRLADYHLLPSVLGDLLQKVGRTEDARVEFTRAASLTRNARERSMLLERAATCMS